MVPVEAVCPVCRTTFLQPSRKQGGGKRTIYCSAKCRSKDWARGNGGKRKAAITKYDTRPENKAAKQARNRKATLAKYEMTEASYNELLTRQRQRCAGCMLPFVDGREPRIDHDHATGKVRGLLCDSCNWALGHAKDSQTTLRRLMAYLERDPSKTMVYLAGALKNPRIPEVGNALRGVGLDVMDEWFTPGEHADTNWQAYERLRGRTYSEALRGRAATNVRLFDRSYIDLSDVFILMMPAGKSALMELGYALALDKHTILFLDGDDPERYDVMPDAVAVISKEADLISHMKELNGIRSPQADT